MMHFTEPGVAGQLDYNGLLDYLELCCTQMGMEVEFFQSNHEGDLIDEYSVCRRPGRRHHPEPRRLRPLQRRHPRRAAPLRRACRGSAAQRTRRARALPQDGHRLVRLSGTLHRRGHQRLSPRCRLSGPAAAAGRQCAHPFSDVRDRLSSAGKRSKEGVEKKDRKEKFYDHLHQKGYPEGRT